MAWRPPRLSAVGSRGWQLLLIASLPGSILRVWAVLNSERLATWMREAADEPPSLLVAFLQLSADHALVTLLLFPLLTVIGLFVYEQYGEELRRAGSVMRGETAPPANATVKVERLSAAAREVLCAASFGGVVRLERQRSGLAVVVFGADGGRDDSIYEFHDDGDPAVAQRYRLAVAELEQVGLLARCDDGHRLTPLGATAARFLNRQELDRIAARARHLDDAELTLLRVVAECQQGYNAQKVALYRDGGRVCVIFPNGETVVVPGVTLPAASASLASSDAAPRSFEQLVQAIPSCYLASLPGQLPRNPFLVRVTKLGLRYLRHAEVLLRDRAAA